MRKHDNTKTKKKHNSKIQTKNANNKKKTGSNNTTNNKTLRIPIARIIRWGIGLMLVIRRIRVTIVNRKTINKQWYE